ncbi:MAG: hypothetical protein KDM63_21805, partial [Verrucomicrobiae bacterium]|nr:hypothetical protein [Verrucomicrobiae bacterium]
RLQRDFISKNPPFRFPNPGKTACIAIAVLAKAGLCGFSPCLRISTKFLELCARFTKLSPRS